MKHTRLLALLAAIFLLLALFSACSQNGEDPDDD